jgi:putative membrane protein
MVSQTKPTDLSTWRGKAALYGKGIAMGLGDSVPGISGGTIAVISNIYDELVFSVRAFDARLLLLISQGKPAAAWRHINGIFLLVLALGILTGLLVSANTVLYLLENQFESLMAFFLGLVLASVAILARETHILHLHNVAALLAGVGTTLLVAQLDPVGAELSYGYLFLCGLIAISAMILPGLSGAFILILLGAYEAMLTALTQLQWLTIVVFMAGCGIGIIAFSRLLASLLLRFRNICYGYICGMLLGSLTVLWPWQQAVSFYEDSDGQQQVLQSVNVWPLNYTELTGQSPQLFWVALCFVLGGAAVLLLRWLFTERH